MGDISLLREASVLSDLSEQEIVDIERKFIPVNLTKGSYLFYRNDDSTGLYLVVRGSLQIIIDNEANKEITVYTIGEGDVVGEMSLFSNSKRSATAVALCPTKLYKIENKQFIDVMKTYPSIAVSLSKILIDRLLAANEMIERLGAMDGNERVTHYIKALTQREGVQDGDDFVLSKRPTYQEISNRLGVSEKTIYRTMKAIAQKGDIEISGRKLTAKPSFFAEKD